MSNLKVYYRFKPLAVDFTSEKDVKKHSKELNSFDDLSGRFDELKLAFDTSSKERADITINILPDIYGLTELSVYHKLKRKLFSKEVKKQCFSLFGTQYIGEKLALREYETEDIEEVKGIFRKLITEHTTPNFDTWKTRYID